MTQIYAVSFDPGESTGIAEWDDSGNVTTMPREMKQKELDEFLVSLESYSPKKFILETWTLWKHRNRQHDKQVTVQVIGQIKAFARRHKIEIIEQRPECRLIAAKWSGTEVPKGHMPNFMSAFLHGYYHLHKIGIIPARVLKDK